jgi:hypothetical protein
MNPELSRIGALVDDGGTTVLAACTYLGLNRTALPEPGTRFTWLKHHKFNLHNARTSGEDLCSDLNGLQATGRLDRR